MKKLSFALVGAATLALAACGGQGDDAAGDNVADNNQPPATHPQPAPHNATGAEPANLEAQADALEDTGEAKEEAIDEADVNASNVNAM